MTEHQIKQILLEDTNAAADRQAAVKRAVMDGLPAGRQRRALPLRPALAVAACLLLAVCLTVLTPQGRAFAATVGAEVSAMVREGIDTVKEGVATLWQRLFPPRDIPVSLEGFEEDVPHSPHIVEPGTPTGGSDPDPGGTGPDAADPAPEVGFVIYVDESSYTAAWEGDTYVISPIPVEYTREDAISGLGTLLEGLSEAEREAKIQEELERLNSFADSLPVRELRISHMADASLGEALTALLEQLRADYDTVYEPEETTGGRCTITAIGGYQWDSPVADVTLVDDGQGGVYVLTARYFLEATEGHGARFSVMAQSFTVLDGEGAGTAPQG